MIIFSGWGICIFTASGDEARNQLYKKKERRLQYLKKLEMDRLAKEHKAYLKRCKIEDSKFEKGNADAGANIGFWYWGGSSEEEMILEGIQTFGTEEGYWYSGSKFFKSHETEQNGSSKKGTNTKTKKGSAKKGGKKASPKKSPKKKRAKMNFDDMDDEEFEAMILAKRKAKRAKKAEKK